MLSAEKHCEILSDNIRDKSSAMYDGFKMFIQMYSGIVGGSVLLRLQFGNKIPDKFIWLSDALVALIVLTSSVVILDHFRSWWGYRVALSASAGRDLHGKLVVTHPKLLLSARTIFVMIVVMLISWGGFIWFNPLQASN